jgi:hypothetical protein
MNEYKTQIFWKLFYVRYLHDNDDSFFYSGEKYCKYKKGLGSAHPAFCSTFL